MGYLYKVFVLLIGFAIPNTLWAQSHGNFVNEDSSPLKIERNNSGDVYYWIDNKALDLSKVDYSDVYETYLTPIAGQLFEDCTGQFVEGKLQLEPTLLQTYSSWNDKTFDAPVNGVLGNDFRRIEVYIYPGAVRKDSVTYSVKGRTKVKTNIRDFTGEIRIKKIYHIFCHDADSEDYYKIIADYALTEDTSQKGSGMFRGILGVYGYISDDAPDIVRVDNRNEVGDGYFNRYYVGTWESYGNPDLIERCMWGDGRLPFRFDFDKGDGETVVNPKYASPEWNDFMQGKGLEIVEPESGDSCASYKNPWW